MRGSLQLRVRTRLESKPKSLVSVTRSRERREVEVKREVSSGQVLTQITIHGRIVH
jgi:hypothetical protein